MWEKNCVAYPTNELAKYTLNDRLWENFIDDKFEIVNDENSLKAIPENAKNLIKIKVYDGHNIKNMLKCLQDFTSGRVRPSVAPSPVSMGTTPPPPSTPTNSTATPYVPTAMSSESGSQSDKLLTKRELFATQAKNMITMAKI